MTSLSMHGCSDVGQRSQNEDCFLVDEDLQLAIVADGMGGHAAGEVASRMVVDTVHDDVSSGLSLEAALNQANLAVLDAARGSEMASMGAAVVAVRLDGPHYEICWVGDCRGYLWNGELVQLTRDHSHVESLLSRGLISWEEALHRPDRNLITQAIGGSGETEIEVSRVRGSLAAGESLLLCSDGLNDILTGQEMAAILAGVQDPPGCCEQLVEAAKAAGGRDNITALLIFPGEEADPEQPDHDAANHPPPVSVSRLDGSVEYFTPGGEKLTSRWESGGGQPEADDIPEESLRSEVPADLGSPEQMPPAPARGRVRDRRSPFVRSVALGLAVGAVLALAILAWQWLVGR